MGQQDAHSNPGSWAVEHVQEEREEENLGRRQEGTQEEEEGTQEDELDENGTISTCSVHSLLRRGWGLT